MPTLTPTPRVMPTPTLPRLQAPGWEGITIETLCLEEELSFPAQEIEEKIAELVRRILAGVGLEVVAEGSSCDATLTIALTGEALGANYAGVGTCYTGAEVTGQFSFAVPDREPLTRPVKAQKPTAIGVTGCNKDPGRAPFGMLWSLDVLDFLAHLWGPPVLVQALGPIRSPASVLLEEVGPRAVPALIQAVLWHENEDVRFGAAMELLEIEPEALEEIPEAVLFLIQALLRRMTEGDNQWLAAEKVMVPEAVPGLILALADDNQLVRQVALWALEGIGPEAREAVPAIIQALGDESERVRRDAAEALGEIGPEAVPALMQAVLWDENEDVRQAAAWALGMIGPEAAEAVPALIEALGDENEDVREGAAEALGNMGPEAVEAVPALIQALGDEDLLVRREAAGALGEMGPEAVEAVPALIQALGDEESRVRKKAALALRQITRQDFGKDADRWQEWWERQE